MSPTGLAALALVFNAFVWGTSWWPFRRLEALGLHPLWATVAIYGLVVLVVAVMRPRALAHLARTPGLWILVIASGTTNAAFNWGVVIGDVVRVVLLFYLMPLWAVLLARWLLGEPLTVAASMRVILALAGATVVLWPGDGGWPLPASLAEALGVIGGFSFALNNVMLRRYAREPGDARAVAMFLGGATVAAALGLGLLALGRIEPPTVPGGQAAAWIAALAALFLCGNLALQFGASRLPANVTAVIMLVEVVFASASALVLGGGSLTLQVAAGGAMILGASLLAARGGGAASGGSPSAAATISGSASPDRASDRPPP
jgi:drug/metabolite transporter (DMT)-like permease